MSVHFDRLAFPRGASVPRESSAPRASTVTVTSRIGGPAKRYGWKAVGSENIASPTAR